MPKAMKRNSGGRGDGGKTKNNNNNKRGDRKKGNGSGMVVTGKRTREIVFDPDARRNYLRGFSERKRQRRAFGLAMQRVKDRKAKIEQRASEKKDEMDRVEQAEHQKAVLLEEAVRERMKYSAPDDNDEDDNNNIDDGEIANFEGFEDNSDDDDDEASRKDRKKKQNGKGNDENVIDTTVYNDTTTESTWGGQVTVTTSVVDLDEDDSDDDNDGSFRRRDKKSVDVEQKYAGNVEKYMNNLKGSLPGKKQRRDGSGSVKAKRKGKDGMANMQGMGGSGNLKIAQKLLSKSKEKNPAGSTSSSGRKDGRGKKGKKRRR